MKTSFFTPSASPRRPKWQDLLLRLLILLTCLALIGCGHAAVSSPVYFP